MKWYPRLFSVLKRTLDAVAGASLMFITLLGFVEVVGRYVFGVSHDWAEELLRYGFILTVFLLGGALIPTNEHLSMALLSDKLKGRGKQVHSVVVNLVGFLLSIFTCYWAIDMIAAAARLRLMGSSYLFPLKYVYLIVPVGMGIYALFSLIEIVKTIRKR